MGDQPASDRRATVLAAAAAAIADTAVVDGEHVLCARLRRADIDAAAGSVEELTRIVGQLRAAWPTVRIIIRGDSGFCREDIMAWCEANGVDYLLGLAKNTRLERKLAREGEECLERIRAMLVEPAVERVLSPGPR